MMINAKSLMTVSICSIFISASCFSMTTISLERFNVLRYNKDPAASTTPAKVNNGIAAR